MYLFNVFFYKVNKESNNKHFLEKNFCEINFSDVVVVLIEQKIVIIIFYLRFWVGELIFHLDFLKTSLS